MKNSFIILSFVLGVLISNTTFANFTYEGHLADKLTDAPIANSTTVAVRVSILPPTGTCVIFQETHPTSTDSKGFFAIQVGSGTNTNNPAGNTFDGVFLNPFTMVATAPCGSYTSAVGDSRRMQIEVSVNAGAYESLGVITLGKAPQAAHADTVGGFDATKLMKVSSGAAPILTSADVTNFNNLIAGTSTLYVQPVNNGVTSVAATPPLSSTGGAAPVISIAQATGAVSGYLASSDFSLFNGKQVAGPYVTTLSGDVTSSGFSAGVVTTMLATVVTPGTYSKVTVDPKGRVTSGLNIVSSDITTALGFLPIATGAPFIAGSVIKAPIGSSSLASYAFSGDASTGMYSPGTSMLEFSTGGVPRVVIKPSGNVGIGTAAPNAALDVAGHISNSGGAAILGACGSATISGNDARGMVTDNAAPSFGSTCIINFNTPYATAPICVVSWNSIIAVDISSVASTTSLNVYFSAPPGLASAKFSYHCMQ